MNSFLILVFFFLFAYKSLANTVHANENDGWRMIDRFYGFRYELLHCSNLNYELYIQNLADEMGCFGWIQRLPLGTDQFKLVGEARCSKKQGPLFQNRIKDDCKVNSSSNHAIRYNYMV